MIVWTFSLVSCEKVIIWNDLHPENSLTTPGQTIPLFIGIVIAMDGFSAFRKPWLYHFRNYLRNCFSKRSNGDHTRTRVRWTTSIINIFGQTCQDLEFGHQSVLAWSKNKTRLASASLENSIKVWDLDNQLVHNLTGHEDMVTSITWSPQNTWLATASLDKTVKLWDLSTGKDLWSRPRHFSTVMRHVSTLIRHLSSRAGNEDSVTSIAWSPREKWLATAVLDKTVRIWDPANGLCEAALTGHEDMVTSIAWSPNEKWLASASLDKTVRIWCQPTSWRLHWSVLTLKEHKDSVTAIAWSHNGTKLASASDDGTIKIWNPGTDKSVKTCQGFSGTITSIAWSLDETQLASASDDGTIRIWNPGTDKSVRTWGFNGRVISVAWSLDGTRLSTYDFGI
jgi:WD40 repeat protein